MIFITQLTYEERAVWGACPVCEAQPGEPCAVLLEDMTSISEHVASNNDDLGYGAHVARLINAPQTIVVNGEITDG